MLSFIKNVVSKCIHGLSQPKIHDEKLKNENGKLKGLTAVSKPWSFFFSFFTRECSSSCFTVSSALRYLHLNLFYSSN